MFSCPGASRSSSLWAFLYSSLFWGSIFRLQWLHQCYSVWSSHDSLVRVHWLAMCLKKQGHSIEMWPPVPPSLSSNLPYGPFCNVCDEDILSSRSASWGLFVDSIFQFKKILRQPLQYEPLEKRLMRCTGPEYVQIPFTGLHLKFTCLVSLPTGDQQVFLRLDKLTRQLNQATMIELLMCWNWVCWCVILIEMT